jgi:hypothetical protein
MSCDRAASREARRIAKREVIDVARQHGVPLVASCPLHPDNDRVRAHEERKKPISGGQWQCNVCGKLFSSEKYLDMHMQRRHADMLRTNDTLCLADYCDLMRCPRWLESIQGGTLACKPSEVAARMHLCQHVFHDCFPPDAEGRALFERLNARFCQQLSCEWRRSLQTSPTATLRALDALGDGAPSVTLYYVLAGVLIAGLAFVYGALACWYREITSRGDLRTRRGRGSSASWWQKAKVF